MGPQGLRSAAQKYFAQTRDTGGPEGLLAAQAQGSTWARAEEGGAGASVWECTCRPGKATPPFLQVFPSSVPLPVAL